MTDIADEAADYLATQDAHHEAAAAELTRRFNDIHHTVCDMAEQFATEYQLDGAGVIRLVAFEYRNLAARLDDDADKLADRDRPT